MQEFWATGISFEYGNIHREVLRPDRDFFVQLYQTFGYELDSLVGLNALTRPFEEQQRTVAEEFYEIDDPKEVMEVNRTVMNVWLYSLIKGSKTAEEMQLAYGAFTDCQKPDKKLTFEDFAELKQMVDSAIPPEMEDVFIASLIYADLGKASSAQEFMRRERGIEYADHDKLIIDVLRDEEATLACVPSFTQMSIEEREAIVAMLESGFHLPQYQKLETLPYHLMKFQALPVNLQDILMLNGLFDVAGAQGDTVQNGSATLDHATFNRFKYAYNSIHVTQSEVNDLTPKERALLTYNNYLTTLNDEEFHYDLSNDSGRAMARFSAMFRTMKSEDYERLPDVFSQLSSLNQQLFIDAMLQTGFEPSGSFWIQYGPAFARNVFSGMRDSGCTYERSMAMSMIMLTVVDSTARRVFRDIAAPDPSFVNVNKLAHVAQKNWPNLIKQRITISRIDEQEGVAVLEPVPEITISERLTSLNHLKNKDGITLHIGVGGGSDCDFARFASDELIGNKGAPVVSFPGVEASNIRNALHVEGPVYLATTETDFINKRSFEAFAAADGPCYIISDTPDLAEALGIIARHIETTQDLKVNQVITVDSGGDILQSTPGKYNRDQHMLKAAAEFESQFGIKNSSTVIMIPGVDSPLNLDDIAKNVDAEVYDITSHAAAFRQVCERFGLPTDDKRWYSQMLNMAALVLAEKAIDGDEYGLQPLRLPLDQARSGRPAFGVTHKSMRNALVIKNNKLRNYFAD